MFSDLYEKKDANPKQVTSYDNAYAIEQIEQGHYSILNRAPLNDAKVPGLFSLSKKTLPRVITLGGDHTITRTLHPKCSSPKLFSNTVDSTTTPINQPRVWSNLGHSLRLPS